MDTLTLPSFVGATATPPQTLLEWVAPSRHDHDRTHRWYVIFAVFILTIAGYAILTGAWSVVLVELLCGGVTYLVRREPMPMKLLRIQNDGFEYQNSFTPWSQCKNFWFVQTPLYTELHISRTKLLGSEIVIQTADIDPTVIRSTLSQCITMKADQGERLLDVIIRLCKL